LRKIKYIEKNYVKIVENKNDDFIYLFIFIIIFFIMKDYSLSSIV